jgi:hypothetical protein
MRKAAGIMLISCGALSLFVYVFVRLTHLHIYAFDIYDIFFMIPAAFIVAGGVFCLKRKYWKLCFASALLAVLMMIFWFFGFPPSDWWFWFFIITGTLPIIFVCLRKSEWQEISACLDFPYSKVKVNVTQKENNVE